MFFSMGAQLAPSREAVGRLSEAALKMAPRPPFCKRLLAPGRRLPRRCTSSRRPLALLRQGGGSSPPVPFVSKYSAPVVVGRPMGGPTGTTGGFVSGRVDRRPAGALGGSIAVVTYVPPGLCGREARWARLAASAILRLRPRPCPLRWTKNLFSCRARPVH